MRIEHSPVRMAWNSVGFSNEERFSHIRTKSPCAINRHGKNRFRAKKP